MRCVYDSYRQSYPHPQTSTHPSSFFVPDPRLCVRTPTHHTLHRFGFPLYPQSPSVNLHNSYTSVLYPVLCVRFPTSSLTNDRNTHITRMKRQPFITRSTCMFYPQQSQGMSQGRLRRPRMERLWTRRDGRKAQRRSPRGINSAMQGPTKQQQF